MRADRGLPRTSYGYQPPPTARATGWYCPDRYCARSEPEPPRRWPYRCPQCGGLTDPVLGQPWAHEALAARLRLAARDKAALLSLVWAAAELNDLDGAAEDLLAFCTSPTGR